MARLQVVKRLPMLHPAVITPVHIKVVIPPAITNSQEAMQLARVKECSSSIQLPTALYQPSTSLEACLKWLSMKQAQSLFIRKSLKPGELPEKINHHHLSAIVRGSWDLSLSLLFIFDFTLPSSSMADVSSYLEKKITNGLDELVTLGSGISRAFLSAPDTVLIDS